MKNTLACDRSGETSTAVMVIMPTRGIAQLAPQQLGQLALDLVAELLRATARIRRHAASLHSVRATSTHLEDLDLVASP